MQFQKMDEGWAVRLDKGEKLLATLHEFLKAQDIQGGYLWGIGSVTAADLGYYDVHTKEYLHKQFSDVYELLSLQGNITMVEGKPFVHAHVLLSGRDYQVFGGHLFEAEVRATVETFISPWSTVIGRQLNEQIGLKLWHFHSKM